MFICRLVMTKGGDCMDHVTLELMFPVDILDYLFEQCCKQGLMPEQYLSNLLYKEKLNEKESKRP